MMGVLACVGDDLGGFEPVPDMHRHVALDHREQIAIERKACQLSAVPMRVVQTPARLGCMAVSRIKEGPDERMVQADTAVEERDESRIRSVGRLHKILHRLGPRRLLLWRHSVEKIGQDSRGGQSLNRSKVTNGIGDLIMRAMADDDYVFRKLKTPSFNLRFPAFKADSETTRMRNETVSPCAV